METQQSGGTEQSPDGDMTELREQETETRPVKWENKQGDKAGDYKNQHRKLDTRTRETLREELVSLNT